MGTSETFMDSPLLGPKETLGAFTLVKDGQDNIMLSLRVVRGQETTLLSLCCPDMGYKFGSCLVHL